MCGITGLVHEDRTRPVDRQVLTQMTEVIRHRGPDSEGFFISRNAGLAMRRLAVIDLESGDQPVSNEDGSAYIVFNGEIYNFQDLRCRLLIAGHRFRSRSDTETIIHLYEDLGVDCVKELRGMFAFAIWDERRQRLFLARDRLGKKPLYYARWNGSLIFGSEIKCLLQYPGFPREARVSALNHYLALQYVPDPWSAFAAVRKLMPGHHLTWEDGQVRIDRYWALAYEPKHKDSETSLALELMERLREALRIRLISDVPLGVHLSGGIDSSLITALTREFTRRIKTFSIGFEEERFSELPYARLVAEGFETNHHEFLLRYSEIPKSIEALSRHFDEPFADPSAIPAYLLAQHTREHVTVALNGDGGDELFAGYVRYGLDRYADIYGQLPQWLTQRAVPRLLARVPQPVDRPGDRNWIAGLKRLSQAARTNRKANAIRWGSYFYEPLRTELWRPERMAAILAEGSSTENELSRIYDESHGLGPLDRTLQVDTRTYLAGDILVKSDRMNMAHSLEGRSPFLDHEFQQWAARLPAHLKWSGRIHKYILKRAAAGVLPDRILKRGKQGFGIPLGAWLRGPLKAWALDRLLDPRRKLYEYLRHEVVSNLFEVHEAGIQSHANRIWAVLMLDLWIEDYL